MTTVHRLILAAAVIAFLLAGLRDLRVVVHPAGSRLFQVAPPPAPMTPPASVPRRPPAEPWLDPYRGDDHVTAS